MDLSEIFLSIQGESTYAGKPCIFIRTAGCNLRCVWCDTQYAYDTKFVKSPLEIIDEISKYKNISLVEVTGGEPLIQEDTFDFLELLVRKKYTVLLETTLSVPIEKVHPDVIKIVDIKCPGSNMSEYNDYSKLKFLQNHDQIKFVLSSREDYNWAKNKLIEYPELVKYEIIFTPVFNMVLPKDLSDWILEDKLKVRLQIQLHKYIGIS